MGIFRGLMAMDGVRRCLEYAPGLAILDGLRRRKTSVASNLSLNRMVILPRHLDPSVIVVIV